MNSINLIERARGFSLVEVMVALLVIAFGILGISKLQAVLIKNASDANNRVQAVSIAQKKIDDLKSFIKLTSATPWASSLSLDELAYQHITGGDNSNLSFNETGGKIPAGPVDAVDLGLDAGDFNFQTTYTLNWLVTDYWYTDELSAPVSVEPTPAPPRSDFKQLDVIVSWPDEAGEEQTVTLNTIINAYAPALTASSDNPSGAGNIGPRAGYTPLAAPDVVPVSITEDGSKLKETSVPEPVVTKREYATLIDFETVTFTDTLLAERREDFTTAACTCKTQTSAELVNHTYGYLEWDEENGLYIDVTKTVQNNNNDYEEFFASDAVQECEICCRDGQYNQSVAIESQDQPFGFNNLDQDGAKRDKVCRLKRIDGILRVIEPWRLIAFNIIPASYFDENQTFDGSLSDPPVGGAQYNINIYSEYVATTVRNALATGDFSVDSKFSTGITAVSFIDEFYTRGDALENHLYFLKSSATPANPLDKRQLQARAVYLDIPPEGYLTKPDGTLYSINGIDPVPLERIPFYETNVTNLVGWQPDEGNIDVTPAQDYVFNHDLLTAEACQKTYPILGVTFPVTFNCVSNQVLTDKTVSDYQRGQLYPVVVGPLKVTASLYSSNDGLANVKVNSETVQETTLNVNVVTDKGDIPAEDQPPP